jgi:chaperonin GroES
MAADELARLQQRARPVLAAQEARHRPAAVRKALAKGRAVRFADVAQAAAVHSGAAWFVIHVEGLRVERSAPLADPMAPVPRNMRATLSEYPSVDRFLVNDQAGQNNGLLSTTQDCPMALRPLNDRIIIQRSEPELKTASGIVIPDSAGEKPEQGEVIAVGPGRRNDSGDFVALNVKVGDKVIFGKYSGQSVKLDGRELLVVREEDLFAVIEQ